MLDIYAFMDAAERAREYKERGGSAGSIEKDGGVLRACTGTVVVFMPQASTMDGCSTHVVRDEKPLNKKAVSA
jgi:hypothetical protein